MVPFRAIVEVLMAPRSYWLPYAEKSPRRRRKLSFHRARRRQSAPTVTDSSAGKTTVKIVACSLISYCKAPRTHLMFRCAFSRKRSTVQDQDVGGDCRAVYDRAALVTTLTVKPLPHNSGSASAGNPPKTPHCARWRSARRIPGSTPSTATRFQQGRQSQSRNSGERTSYWRRP